MIRNLNDSTNTVSVLPLGTLGVITGIVLCILQGVGTIDIGWFWATFPFWIVPAVTASALLILMTITLTYISFKNRK